MAMDLPTIYQGVLTMAGRTLMLRIRATRELIDVVHLLRSRYMGHHITIAVTDHGTRNPAGPHSEGD